MENNRKNSSYGKFTRIFIPILGVQALLEFILGIAMLIDFPLAVESGFQLPYTENMALFGTVISLQLLFLTAIMVIAIMMIRRGEKFGAILGIVVGAYFAIFGLAAFVLHGNLEAIFIDSIRGFLTIGLGFLSFKELD